MFKTHLAKYTKKIAPTTSCSAVSNGPAPEEGSYLKGIWMRKEKQK